MSDAFNTAIRVSEETSYKTLPASPVFREYRTVDDSLDAQTRWSRNDERRTDLLPTGGKPVGEEAGGGWNGNLYYGALHDPLRSVFGSNIAAAPVRENLVAGNVGGAAITLVDDSNDWYEIAASAGTVVNSGTPTLYHIIVASGFGQAANNGMFVVAGAVANKIPVASRAAEAVAPVGARIKVVGFEAPIGDLVAVVGGSGYAGKLTTTTLDFTTMGIQPGDPLKIGGTASLNRFATAGVNGVVVVQSVAAHELVLSEVPATWAGDTGATKQVRVWLPDTLVQGTAVKTFNVEKHLGGDVAEYHYFPGTLFNSVTVNVPQEEKITYTVGAMSAKRDAPVTVRKAGATTLAANTGLVYDAANNVLSFRVDGVELAFTIYTGIEWTFARPNAARRGAFGGYGSTGANINDFSATARLQMYYAGGGQGAAVLSKVASGATISLSQTFAEPQGQTAHGIYVPRAQYSAAPMQNQGNQRMLSASVEASASPTLGYAVKWAAWEHFEA